MTRTIVRAPVLPIDVHPQTQTLSQENKDPIPLETAVSITQDHDQIVLLRFVLENRIQLNQACRRF